MLQLGKAPLHERIPPLGWLRRPLRSAFFALLRRVSDTDDAKALATATLQGLLRRHDISDMAEDLGAVPYPHLGVAQLDRQTSQRSDIILITARFRSGSTLFWNLFRSLDGFTAYYEPLNERRWFDPDARGSQTDPTHRNVDDYWREYDGLEVLSNYYREAWIRQNLFMDESFWDPDLKRYVEILVERAPGRPVLQFNRIDFRLPWFRKNFPNARLLHLYRDPRDQWCSALLDPTSLPKEGTMAEFAARDGFYLLTWAKDLKYQFPFLDEQAVAHPYQLFYYIWKLSYLFGRQYAHYSLAFERLVTNPDAELAELFRMLRIERYDLGGLKSVLVEPTIGKWRSYADDSWFRHHETICETTLREFLGQAAKN
jgi:hypothetical protein